jgi:hypothetical protein
MKTKFLFIGLVLAGFVFWLTTDQRSFVTDVRESVTQDIELIELCVPSGPCKTLDRNDNAGLSDAIKYLSQAEAKLPPAKTPISSEKLVKIKTRGSQAGTFQHCFRLVEFVGVAEAYLNQIVSDAECRRIDKYLSAYVAIHRLN